MLEGENPKVFVKTFYVFHEGKVFVQIAAIQIPVNNLLQIGCQNLSCRKKCSS